LLCQTHIVTRITHLLFVELGRQGLSLDLVDATPGHHVASEAKGEGAHQSRRWLQLRAGLTIDKLATGGHGISSMVVSFAQGGVRYKV
jgi:hypothetical protein